MTTTTESYREVLDALARSRGLSGADELAETAAEGTPFTPDDLLAGAWGGFGWPLDDVLGLDDAERRRVSDSWRRSVVAPMTERLRGRTADRRPRAAR